MHTCYHCDMRIRLWISFFEGKNSHKLVSLEGWCLSGENENMRKLIGSFMAMKMLNKHYKDVVFIDFETLGA